MIQASSPQRECDERRCPDEGLRGRRRFEQHVSAGEHAAQPGEGKTAAQRIADFKRLLEDDHVVAETMPTATRLFELYVPSFDTERPRGEGLLRVLSGSTHAKVWSLAAMSERPEVVEHEGGGLSFRIFADEERTYKVTVIAMSVARAAFADLDIYAGAALLGSSR